MGGMALLCHIGALQQRLGGIHGKDGHILEQNRHRKTPYSFSEKNATKNRIQKRNKAMNFRKALIERYMCVLMVASETPSSEAASA